MKNFNKVFTLCVMIFTIAVLSPILLPVQAQEDTMQQAIVKAKLPVIERIARYPMVVKAVKDQNAKGMSIEQIMLIDKEWIAGGQVEFAQSLQENNAGKYLTNQVKMNKALFTEAFLCDQNGAVVAEYPKTSDYWQGDEEKFTASFNNGNGKVFVGEPEYDESTKANTIQVSVPVKDEDKTIGVLIMGIKYFSKQ